MTTRTRGLFIEHQADAHPGHLGDRAVERGVEVVIHSPADGPFPEADRFDFVVSLGSGDSVNDEALPYGDQERALLARAVEADVPVLGVCFGAQLLCATLGGSVERMPTPEIGWFEVDTDDADVIEPGPWLAWHFDAVIPPPGAVEIARTPRATQVFAYGPHLGVQFHPEATLSSVAAWARTYHEAITAGGTSVEALNAESRARACQARAAAHRLLDRFLDRLGT